MVRDASIRRARRFQTQGDAWRGRRRIVLTGDVPTSIAHGDEVRPGETERVRRGDNSRDEAVLEVQDTGIGIEPDQIDDLFKEFVQADGSSTRKYGGTGLGLALSQKYAQMMGGHISVSSMPGEGSVFTLHLPLNAPEAASDLDALPQVLVVDDDPAMRELLERALGRAGYQVTGAENGRLGLDLLKQSPPGAILLDLKMPEVDGFTFVDELHKHDDWKHIPVVIITSKDLTREDRQRLEGQVAKVLPKGADPSKGFLKRVKRSIEDLFQQTGAGV